jgi:hypothetical protein
VASFYSLFTNQPVTAVQSLIPREQLAVGSALVVFCMYFGGALFLSLGQTVLINRLRPALAKYLPQVSPQAVINAGAMNARGNVPESVLPDLILAYNQAITQVFVSEHQVLA